MNIRKRMLAVILLPIGMYSCTQPKKDSSANKLPLEKDSETAIKGCYLYTVNKDTFQLAITAINKNEFEGSLIYNFYEKDDSKGTFNGSFDGEILKGDYTFQAEGTTSVREVVFKKTKIGFVEGSGAVKDSVGKTIFSKPDSISYKNGIEFRKTENCLP